jgi:hypothetical protein
MLVIRVQSRIFMNAILQGSSFSFFTLSCGENDGQGECINLPPGNVLPWVKLPADHFFSILASLRL